MPIQVGDSLPDITLKQVTEKAVSDVNTQSLFKGKKAVLFAVPGAFTPTCTEIHMPGFSKKMDEFKTKDLQVMCIAVNDPFVMRAWARATQAHPDIIILSDWNGDFARAVGLTIDGSGAGLGLRSSRYSMVIVNRVVTALHVEPNAGQCTVSSGDSVLGAL